MSALTGTERDIVAGIEAGPILDRTLAWAAVNSGTGNADGLAHMARLLGESFGVLPGEISLIEPAPVEQIAADGTAAPLVHGRHFLLRVRPQADRRVMLMGHMDTVYPAHSAFQTCEWLDDDTLRGPGTADMKAGLSLMLEGLLAFERSGPSLGYDVLINSDEETGSRSSSHLIADIARGKIAALDYEPSLPGGRMARARPGSSNVAIVVRGRSAHAGRNPQEGRNALVAAAELAVRLGAAARPGLSVNPARIEGGAPNNQVPDIAVLHVNMRPRGVEDAAEIAALLDRLIAEVGTAREVSIALHQGSHRPPKPVLDADERLFALVSAAAAALGEAVNWTDTGGVCDGNNIRAASVPVIDTMGACGGEIHSPREFLQVDSLAPRARLTALVMHRIEQGLLDLGDFGPGGLSS